MNLAQYERKYYSQFDEDGVTLALVDQIGPPHYFLEIGSGDGSENCTRVLAAHRDWVGMWIDADVSNCTKALAVADPLGIEVRCQRVSLLNTGAIKQDVRSVFGVLSIDIDGNDYHVWKSLCSGPHGLRPAICIIECQIQQPRDKPYIMTYQEDYRWDNKGHDCGASVFSMRELGAELGYVYLGMLNNPHAPNAFFVREDLVKVLDDAAGT